MHLRKLSGRWEQPPQGLFQNEAVTAAPKMACYRNTLGKSSDLLSREAKSSTSGASHITKRGVVDDEVKVWNVTYSIFGEVSLVSVQRVSEAKTEPKGHMKQEQDQCTKITLELAFPIP